MTTSSAFSAPPPANFEIVSTASATYVPTGYTQTETAQSNTVIAIVAGVEALTLTQDQNVVRPPNAQVTLTHLLTNTGNMQSSYTLNWVNDGPGCSASAFSLSALRLVRDVNNNGVVDAGDPVVALNTPGVITLNPGETASLLVQGTVPNVTSGSACLTLSATTAAQQLSATNHDTVTITNAALLSLTKSAVYSGPVVPGTTRVDFTVNGTNIGAQDAQATSTALPGATSIVVNGKPTALILVRDAIPTGMQYIAGSLQSTAPGVLRLFRLPGDAPFNYRTGADDASAIEVAIGVPAPGVVARNASIQMSFGAIVESTATADITNVAQSYYNDGTQPALSPSNVVLIPLKPAQLTVTKTASTAIANMNAGGGGPNGTSDVVFSINVKNTGSAWLYGMQVPDILESAGGTSDAQFGTYTTASVPGVNQYTVLPGTVQIVAPNGTVGGTVAAANTAFNGTSKQANLLAASGVLPPLADVTVQFTVRFNTTGRPATLTNQVTANAALVVGGPPVVSGKASANVSTQMPALTVAKSVVSRFVSAGIYDLDYTISVTNSGVTDAPNVRLIDNLNCTFDMDVSTGQISGWQLTGPVKVNNGYLVPSTSFTGAAQCDRTKLASSNPYDLPTEVGLSLVDGTRGLAVGQTETASFTVRVTEKSNVDGSAVSVTNKAWAASLAQNTINVTPSSVLAAAMTSAQTLLVAPEGTVYDAVTRQPIAGAVVTMARQSCTTATPRSIMPADILNGSMSTQTYNADGSVSVTTGADGTWSFYMLNGMCTYSLTVTPPAGSAYTFRSQRIPPTAGTYASCGTIVPNATPPQGSEPTTYYLSQNAGVGTNRSVCAPSHNHIPLDPGATNGLLLHKEASKRQVEFGDFVDYALTLTNKTGVRITGVNFSDTLPAGLAYVSRSSRLNGTVVADPQGGAGPRLVWNFPTQVLDVNESIMVRYRVRVGVGAKVSGSATNRASASAPGYQSNEATATIMISGGVFSDEAFAFGKVYMDCRRDRVQSGEDEPGIPGVRLWLEDGTNVVTDGEGKWSLYGLSPKTHVLRLDQTTLPAGASIELLDNRNAEDPQSRFLDLKNGEFQKGNFPILGCEDPDVMKEVKARRELVAKRADTDGEALVRQRLDPTGQVIAVGDTRALPASGQIDGVGLGGATTPTISITDPLIALPTTRSGSGDVFLNGSGQGLGGTLASAQQGGVAQSMPVQSVMGGTRSLPDGGVASSVGTIGSAGPNPSSGTLEPAALPLLPQGAGSVVELESLMHQLDNTPAFIELKDHDTVATQSINVRVKGPAGTTLRLTVNGAVIDGKRVGKKATLPRTQTTAWEYIGVVLKPGLNTLRLDVVDDFGVTRGAPQEIQITAPDKLGQIRVEVPSKARADLITPVPIKVVLTDAAGVPITARTQVTLEADAGRWAEEDLNPNEPGLQAFVEGGQATFHLIPPGTPGDVRIRVSAASFVKEVRLALLPDLRPMIAVGVVEGTIDLSNRGQLAIGQTPAGAAFEQELSAIGKGDGNTRAGARTAFFLKGAIKGEYLLTAALDTGKSSQDRLFRDIRPDEFYPIYGDSSGRGFDAQSSQRLYVRVDKDRSYLLYGDFMTASSAEVRKLSQISRTLTGIKNVYQTDNARVTSYASRTSQTQQVEEFPARGISGPYYLAGTGDLVANSEQIEILVRDRNQPNLILQRTAMVRFVDYTIEPLSKRILFTRPIASSDEMLNPQSIRVTYEVDNGGPKYMVAGTDAQFKVGENLQLGVVANTDRDPQNRRDLLAVTALGRIGENTSVAAEAVRTKSDENDVGNAERLEVRHQTEKLGVTAQVARSSTGFDNPGAGYAAGRTEANARAEYRIDPTTAARGELLYSKDAYSDGSTRGASVGVLKRISDMLSGELGMRYGVTSSASSASMFSYNQVSSYNGAFGSNQAGSSVTGLGSVANSVNSIDSSQNSLTTVRGRLTANVPYVPQAQVFVEGEQDVRDGSRHMAAVGGSYAVTDKTRIYGRYELASSLYDFSNTSVTRNKGILGIESNYMEGGRIYNEYRLADSLDGRAAQTALGVRNTVKVTDKLSVTGGVERTRAFGQGASNGSVNGLGDSTAVVSGVEYGTSTFRASGVLEARNGSDSNTLLASAGVAFKLNPDWSVLARGIYSSTKGNGQQDGNERTLSREQIGIAYRPVDQDVWNALARYEYRTERIRGNLTTAGAISGNAFGSDISLPGDYRTHIVSMHVNVNPQPGDYVMGRVAAKISTQDDGMLKSTYAAQLLQLRWTHDINKKWDMGVQGAMLHGSGGALQKSAGLEVGYIVMKNLWFSVGYNVIGLSDRDLTAGEYTSRGAYIRLRYKFDETTLGFKPTGYMAPKPPESKPVTPVVEEAPKIEPEIVPQKVVLQAGTLFAFDKSELLSAGRDELDKLAKQLASIDYDLALVIGYTDSVGKDAYNQVLSERRANAVRDYLIAHGVDASRIRAEGRGKREPVASNATPAGRALNRRVVIEISGTQKS
ncbi:OmpA family protein [Burkholderia sp. BCC0405]|uniref:OmpA family protein n=1 Tax=Burkholderia sp. BCC0405 TaxID=2676298 RepID=UPI00158DDA71|nr:OmpA family protein [Burkholderia sp. BCC0405]